MTLRNSMKVKPMWQNYIGDFANMLKAFIGSNYLTVSYAFLQSGLGLGIGGLLLIATLTDHCCHLIVKAKYHAINHVIRLYKENKKPEKSDTMTSKLDSGSDIFSSDSEEDTVIYDVDEISMIEQHMTKHMSYGDVGQISFGNFGRYIVNICISITQFCFCVAYSIFLGNTVYSLFPSKVCNNPVFGVDNVSALHSSVPECEIQYLGLLPSSQIKPRNARSLPKFVTYQNLSSVDDILLSSSTNISVTSLSSIGTTSSVTINNLTTNSTTQFTTTASSPTAFVTVTESLISPAANLTGEIIWSTAPDLKLLVLCPLPIFIIFALIRNIRRLGWISVLANTSILVGCGSVLIYLIFDFQVHETVTWANVEGLPVFFGMVTAAYEGIGLVIPVESSMEGNRHNFAAFLHGALGVLSIILGGFGVLGYLRFGEELNQMLNTNIPSSNWVSVAVNICAIVGVTLTFPLQIYPVIEMCEILLFSEGSIFGPKRSSLDEEDGKKSLLPDKANQSMAALPISVAVHIPKSVPAWKRNILRILLVLLSSALAVLFRNSFALIGAFTGAVGSSLLAYIFPCVFHLKLCHQDVSWFICIKDVVIIVVGVICSAISLYSVTVKLIQETTV